MVETSRANGSLTTQGSSHDWPAANAHVSHPEPPLTIAIFLSFFFFFSFFFSSSSFRLLLFPLCSSSLLLLTSGLLFGFLFAYFVKMSRNLPHNPLFVILAAEMGNKNSTGHNSPSFQGENGTALNKAATNTGCFVTSGQNRTGTGSEG